MGGAQKVLRAMKLPCMTVMVDTSQALVKTSEYTTQSDPKVN